MEYNNNYYPAQSGHPPPHVTNQQHGGPQMQQQPPPDGGQMMHAPMPPQNIRQAMPPGPPSHHQQMQQHQQHIGHHSQQMPPQQQHPNYHQIQPHPHGPPASHSGSPHPQQQHHNHQPTLAGPPPQQSAIPSQQHHMHSQSPHHHGGPPMHMQQQQLNHIVRPPLGPSVMNHPQQGLQQPPHHHQNFFSGGPIPQSNLHHFPQQNQHHPHHQPQQHHHQPPMMHHAPPPSLPPHHPHIQQGIGRSSPYYQGILQTEFRIIELNRRLQSRPILRHPASPLPNNPYDESLWWERFASEFFEDDATLTLRIHDDKPPMDYTIGRTLIPRFFRTYFDGGVTDLSINLRNPKEACLHPQLITLDCDQAFIITNNIFRHPAMPPNQGVVVHTEGHLILDFVQSNLETLSIKSWKFFTKGCREYIDRSIMTAMGLPNPFPVEPMTRQGLTKTTFSYLKMCMIMEPMQELMSQHKLTKLEPKTCLRKFLMDKYNFRGGEDNRNATNKRRKRKPSAPAITGMTTNKRSKANVNNSLGNNSSLNNNIMMSPSTTPSFSLASQDVMVVGEPSMMGGDFGDDNERMITRLENTQYDPSVSTLSNTEESDSMNTSTVNDNGLSNSNNIDSSLENHTPSPSLLQQRQQQQVPPQIQVTPQPNQVDQPSPQVVDQQQQQRLQLSSIPDQPQKEQPTGQVNQINLIERTDMPIDDVGQISQQSVDNQSQANSTQISDSQELVRDDIKQEITDETEVNSMVEAATNDSKLMLGVNSVEQMENHTSSIQPLNEESNSNSQLPCSTASATPATIEQQQPVDNGVA